MDDAPEERSPSHYQRMLCECGHATCERVVAITATEYTQLRSRPLHFAVAREHVIADVERIVSENDRFVVVAKREGTPADVAAEQDPRL